MAKDLSNIAQFLLIATALTAVDSTFTPNTNCIFQRHHKLFILVDLQADQPYQATTHQGHILLFNFCHSFLPPQCPLGTPSSLGFLIYNHQQQCQPLSSPSASHFKTEYGVSYRHADRNVLTIDYQQREAELTRTLKVELICSQTELYIIEAKVEDQKAIIIAESIHGCPVYQIPAMLEFLTGHQIVIAFIAMLVGFFFLFFGRTFFRVVAFLTISCGFVTLGCWACFRLMEHDTAQGYLYLAISLILFLSVVVAYLAVRFMLSLALFCLGALGAFFIMSYFKTFVLSFFDDNEDTLLTAAIVYLVITVVCMTFMGAVLLKSKQIMVIVMTAIIGAYLLVRGASLLIGGFPPLFQVIQLIESKHVTAVSLGFFLYLAAIVLLALVGMFYQMRKLRAEANGESEGSSGSRSYIYQNVDKIHQKIDQIINRNNASQGHIRAGSSPSREQFELGDYHAMTPSSRQ